MSAATIEHHARIGASKIGCTANFSIYQKENDHLLGLIIIKNHDVVPNGTA
jgi:hypothetical protein